jgi:hypothetical protein
MKPNKTGREAHADMPHTSQRSFADMLLKRRELILASDGASSESIEPASSDEQDVLS